MLLLLLRSIGGLRLSELASLDRNTITLGAHIPCVGKAARNSAHRSQAEFAALGRAG
jgi:hypothetical protein